MIFVMSKGNDNHDDLIRDENDVMIIIEKMMIGDDKTDTNDTS